MINQSLKGQNLKLTSVFGRNVNDAMEWEAKIIKYNFDEFKAGIFVRSHTKNHEAQASEFSNMILIESNKTIIGAIMLDDNKNENLICYISKNWIANWMRLL